VDYNFLFDFLVSNGFNAMRIPFYLDLVLNDAKPDSISTNCQNNHTCNNDLVNLTSLEVLDKMVNAAGDRGILILFDLHSFGPGTFMNDGLWYDTTHSEAKFVQGWEKLLKRYASAWNVMGLDLKNEPKQGTWGTGNETTDWDLAVARIGGQLLQSEGGARALIFAEGVASSPPCADNCFWGEDMEGARDHPIKLPVPNKLVYSPHVYGPAVAYQPYFAAPDFPKNMPSIWQRHWAYLREQNGGAIAIGEWGGTTDGANGKWTEAFVSFLRSIDARDNFFWSLNPDSGDTGGLLKYDWITPETAKLALLEKLQPNPTKIKPRLGGSKALVCAERSWEPEAVTVVV